MNNCPQCGTNDQLYFHPDSVNSKGETVIKLVCHTCWFHNVEGYSTTAEAVQAWNSEKVPPR